MPGNLPYKGDKSNLLVGMESDQGVIASPDRHMGLVLDNASMPDPEIDWIEERVLGGGRELYNKVEGQNLYEGGTINVAPYDGAPLAYLLGKEQGSGPVTLTALEEDIPPTQTIHAMLDAPASSSGPNLVREFYGCTPTSGQIQVGNDGELLCSLDYVAMGVDVTDTTTGDPPANKNPWVFTDTSSNLTLFGTSFARVNDFSLSVSNNIEQGRYIHDDNPEEPYELTYGPVDYQLNTTITVDDRSIYEELLEPTVDGFECSMSFTKPSGDTLTITAKKCNFANAPHDVPAQVSTIDVDVQISPEDLEITVPGGPYLTTSTTAGTSSAAGD